MVQMLSAAVATFILPIIGVPERARSNATVWVDTLPLPVLSRNRAACSIRRAAYDEVAKPFFILRRSLHFVGSEVRFVRGLIAEDLIERRAPGRFRGGRAVSQSVVR